jgi:hypothetical protein
MVIDLHRADFRDPQKSAPPRRREAELHHKPTPLRKLDASIRILGSERF